MLQQGALSQMTDSLGLKRKIGLAMLVAVVLYGTFGWSIEGFGLNLESFEFTSCTVAVEESSWSNLKTLFR